MCRGLLHHAVASVPSWHVSEGTCIISCMDQRRALWYSYMAYRVLHLILYAFAKQADIEFPRKKVQRLGKQQVGRQMVKYYPENASLYDSKMSITTIIIIYHTFPRVLRKNQCMNPGCMFTCRLIVGGDSLGQLVNSRAPETAI